ncbi:hypothetical protein [Pseudomonas fluorescens]|uniref:Uncharacterized protein n=1 Tax=Pseudomonas fluorescens TaxID=294 RepID=A0A423LMV9_PSEFL|nr:hypothetical protein [Pseudomonas fluorescens]RON69691.1 hypothetical protein BK671_09765 [Pseudomonas fluorescens]
MSTTPTPTPTPTPRKKSLGAIKKHAKEIQRESEGHTYLECLNLAAVKAGFQNYNHAFNHATLLAKVRLSDLVKCEIKWNEFRPAFPERVGDLFVTVTPSQLIPENVLQRLVFFCPEFWIDSETGSYEREHFRIDSAYFNRVTGIEYLKESTKVKRGVLSFHLLKNHWRASIFDYGTKLSRDEMAVQIKRAVIDQITDTLERYLSEDLEPARIISQENHAHMVDVWEAHDIQRMLDTV